MTRLNTRYSGLILMALCLLLLMAGSLLFKSPGSWNAYMATEDIPLLGFWLAMGLVAGSTGGFLAVLMSYGDWKND